MSDKGSSVTYNVELNVELEVTIGDQSAILRCTENQDDQGVPQPDVRGGSGWRNSYYALDTPEKVIEHLAENCARNGVTDASHLDGWGDLERGVVTMSVENAYTGHVTNTTAKDGSQ